MMRNCRCDLVVLDARPHPAWNSELREAHGCAGRRNDDCQENKYLRVMVCRVYLESAAPSWADRDEQPTRRASGRAYRASSMFSLSRCSEVSGGYIGRLRLRVPWKHLYSGKVSVFVEVIHFEVERIGDGTSPGSDVDLIREMREAKEKAIAVRASQLVDLVRQRDEDFSGSARISTGRRARQCERGQWGSKTRCILRSSSLMSKTAPPLGRKTCACRCKTSLVPQLWAHGHRSPEVRALCLLSGFISSVSSVARPQGARVCIGGLACAFLCCPPRNSEC